jgi:mono/diheme cytochrome c family protein
MRFNAVTVGAFFPLVLVVMTLAGTEIVAGQATSTAAMSGRDLFYNNCAACHGVGAKGDGPMGAVLTIRPADLTILAKKTAGKFPAAQIYQMIDGRDPAVKGHGGPDMPVWGDVFAAKGNAASVKDRLNALV